jgi:hypothetical protein
MLWFHQLSQIPIHDTQTYLSQRHLNLQKLTVGLTPPSPFRELQLDEAPSRFRRSRLLALRGNFDDALDALIPLDENEPAVAFEKARILARRGHLTLAKEASYRTTPHLIATSMSSLLELARAQIECFTDGAWLVALRAVCNVFVHWLRSNNTPDIECLQVR